MWNECCLNFNNCKRNRYNFPHYEAVVGSGHVECCKTWGSHSSGGWVVPDVLKAQRSFKTLGTLNQRQHHIPEDLNLHVECCAYILSLFCLLNPGFPNSVPSKQHVQPITKSTWMFLSWWWRQHSLYLILQPGLELQHTINIVKVKVVPVHAMKAYRSGCMVPLILNLGTRWRWAGSFTF